MRVEVESGGKKFVVEVDRTSGRVQARVDDRPLEAEAIWLSSRHLSLTVGGRSYDVEVVPSDGRVGADGVDVFLFGEAVHVAYAGASAVSARKKGSVEGLIAAHMPGKVVAVLVALDDAVVPGQAVVVVEAMKMENELQTAIAGRVRKIHVQPGQIVETGAALLEIG